MFLNLLITGLLTIDATYKITIRVIWVWLHGTYITHRSSCWEFILRFHIHIGITSKYFLLVQWGLRAPILRVNYVIHVVFWTTGSKFRANSEKSVHKNLDPSNFFPVLLCLLQLIVNSFKPMLCAGLNVVRLLIYYIDFCIDLWYISSLFISCFYNYSPGFV